MRVAEAVRQKLRQSGNLYSRYELDVGSMHKLAWSALQCDAIHNIQLILHLQSPPFKPSNLVLHLVTLESLFTPLLLDILSE